MMKKLIVISIILTVVVPLLIVRSLAYQSSLVNDLSEKYVYTGAVKRELSSMSPNNSSRYEIIDNPEKAYMVADAILFSLYGPSIREEKPYLIKLVNDSIWVIDGNCHFSLGGNAHLQLSKNGTVLSIYHEK